MKPSLCLVSLIIIESLASDIISSLRHTIMSFLSINQNPSLFRSKFCGIHRIFIIYHYIPRDSFCCGYKITENRFLISSLLLSRPSLERLWTVKSLLHSQTPWLWFIDKTTAIVIVNGKEASAMNCVPFLLVPLLLWLLLFISARSRDSEPLISIPQRVEPKERCQGREEIKFARK